MESKSTSGLAPVARMFWMMIGPAIILILALTIANHGGGWLSGKSIAIPLVFVGLIVARWLEFRGGDPRTASGEPATKKDLRTYALEVVAVGLAVWIVANVIGNRA